MKYGKELRCLNTKGKYGKVTNTWMKWSIISKLVMIVMFVEFIDQLIDYLINRPSLNSQLLFLDGNYWAKPPGRMFFKLTWAKQICVGHVVQKHVFGHMRTVKVQIRAQLFKASLA